MKELFSFGLCKVCIPEYKLRTMK